MASNKHPADALEFRGAIPNDLVSAGKLGRTVNMYPPLEARDLETSQNLDNNGLLRYILKNSDIDILLRSLGTAFFPRPVLVGTTPTTIVPPNRYPRGYIFVNPNTTVSGVATTVTIFPAPTVWTSAASQASSALNVSGHRSVRLFLNITVAGGTLNVDAQTQDPISGNWATSQADIFSGASGVGTYYANIGDLGVDGQIRFLVSVTGADVTGSIAAILKEAYGATVAGPIVFMGNESVNATVGYPLLSGNKETWYLKENVELFGMAVAPTTINVFELQ